jgi:hypothetical protein
MFGLMYIKTEETSTRSNPLVTVGLGVCTQKAKDLMEATWLILKCLIYNV